MEKFTDIAACGSHFLERCLVDDQIIPARTFICAIQQDERDLSCIFFIFTGIPGPRRLFYSHRVEEPNLLRTDFYLPLPVLWSYVLYPTWIRVTWTTGMAWITWQIYYTRETPLDNLVKVVALACGHMQEDSLHRCVGGCAEYIVAFHIWSTTQFHWYVTSIINPTFPGCSYSTFHI